MPIVFVHDDIKHFNIKSHMSIIIPKPIFQNYCCFSPIFTPITPFQNLSSKIIIPYFQGYLLDPIALTSIAVSIFYNNND